ncbi:MAG: hypothetical protein FWD43_00890, partial [Coriobacteriia bacterium]|nr:hypothetical protein [Coriobacteriia bacterium]
AARTEGTSAGLFEGMKMTLLDMLYCLLLPSGNDAAVCVAENVAGFEAKFVGMMNEKAKELGMNDTNYSDSSGLTEEEHYTTVLDTFILTRYAMQNETFRKIVGTRYKEVDVSGYILYLNSTNQLYGYLEDAKVTGVKTGTNYDSGYCFIGSAIKYGVELYAVFFQGNTRAESFVDAATLLEWGFRHFRTIELINPSQQVGTVACTSWLDKTVAVYAPAAIRIEIFDLDGPIDQIIVMDDIKGAVVKGQVCGQIIWKQNGVELASSELVAGERVAAPNFFESLGIAWKRFWGGFKDEPEHAEGSILLLPQVPVPPIPAVYLRAA